MTAVLPRLGLVSALLVASACARPRTPPDVELRPVTIPFSPSDAACCLALEQRVVVDSPRGSTAFDVAVEIRETELVVVGFTTYGLRAFSLVHSSTGLEVETTGVPEVRAIPFDRVVRDIYAAFLVRSGDVGATSITDGDADGPTRSRTVVFDRGSADEERVEIAYGEPGFVVGGSIPDDVVVRHVAIGLAIRIRTSSRTPITDPRPTE